MSPLPAPSITSSHVQEVIDAFTASGDVTRVNATTYVLAMEHVLVDVTIRLIPGRAIVELTGGTASVPLQPVLREQMHRLGSSSFYASPEQLREFLNGLR